MHTAETYRKRDREKERDRDRQNPNKQAGIKPPNRRQESTGDCRGERMRPYRFNPPCAACGALLRIPFDGSAGKCQEDEFAMEPHPQRREQGGQNDLANDARAKRAYAAEIFSVVIFDDQEKTKELWQEQKECRGARQSDRPLRIPLRPNGKKTRL